MFVEVIGLADELDGQHRLLGLPRVFARFGHQEAAMNRNRGAPTLQIVQKPELISGKQLICGGRKPNELVSTI